MSGVPPQVGEVEVAKVIKTSPDKSRGNKRTVISQSPQRTREVNILGFVRLRSARFMQPAAFSCPCLFLSQQHMWFSAVVWGAAGGLPFGSLADGATPAVALFLCAACARASWPGAVLGGAPCRGLADDAGQKSAQQSARRDCHYPSLK